MFRKIWNKIVSSDWHLFHPNIYIFEFEKRKVFLSWIKEFESVSNSDELKMAFSKIKEERLREIIDLATERMLNYALNWLKTNDLSWVNHYINMWDFIFNPNESRLKKVMRYPFYNILSEMNEIFISKNIKRTLCLWNHDLNHWREALDVMPTFYEFFDEVVDYEMVGSDIFCHMPIWVTESKFHIWPYHMEVDWILLDIAKKNGKVVCYHGHTHSNDPDVIINGIEYINCSMEHNM